MYDFRPIGPKSYALTKRDKPPSRPRMRKKSKMNQADGERLIVHPHCLMFFVDETGHETFADPQYPVFGLGGCALLAAAITPVLRTPWRQMKALHFGGADVPLHASDLRSTPQQLQALDTFFRNQRFGRFAVTLTPSALPAGFEAMQIMPRLIRRRWQDSTPATPPAGAMSNSSPPTSAMRINSSSWARSSTLNRTTYFLTAISFPTTNHLHRCLAATEIQKLPSFSMTGATRPPQGLIDAGWSK
jgi:hypothetical protein